MYEILGIILAFAAVIGAVASLILHPARRNTLLIALAVVIAMLVLIVTLPEAEGDVLPGLLMGVVCLCFGRICWTLWRVGRRGQAAAVIALPLVYVLAGWLGVRMSHPAAYFSSAVYVFWILLVGIPALTGAIGGLIVAFLRP